MAESHSHLISQLPVLVDQLQLNGLPTNILEKYIKSIINKGDDQGNEIVVKFKLPSGLEIVGLPTKNFYGGHWDLGPTWNYAVMADCNAISNP